MDPQGQPSIEPQGASALEIGAAFVLGLAALLTAFSAYRGSTLDGEAIEGYTQSSQALSDANFFFEAANTQVAFDRSLFVEYVSASTGGNTESANFIRTGVMSPNLQAAMAWWEVTDAALTPFDLIPGNPYVTEASATAGGLQAEADRLFVDASLADERGDRFELVSVFFAVTLFFGGIATLFRPPKLTRGMLSVAGLSVVAGVVLLLPAL